jgi:hypothetical protein
MYQFNNLTTQVPNVQTFNSTSLNDRYTIGQSALGGIIGYILQPGDPGYDANFQKGLVTTISNISTAAIWGCNNIIIPGADGTAIGTGNQNTIDIMAGCATAGITARLCGDLVQEGYSDWYLPSKDELNKLYLNRVAIGGFANAAYSSSSEVGSTQAWYQDFTNGNQIAGAKNVNLYVRAVRSFSEPFPSSSSLSSLSWQTWNKIDDATMIHILCIGGGGGGGSGKLDSSATAKFGGGGGGAGAVTSMFVPAFLIPDTLYIQVGQGGKGSAAQTVNGTSGNSGSNGGTSYVSVYPSFTGAAQVQNLIIQSNTLAGATTVATGGSGGTSTIANGGVGGSAFVINTAANAAIIGLGQFTSTSGQAGGASSASSNPTAITISNITCGGAAGGGISSAGTAYAGGSINSPSALISYLTSLPGGVANGTSATILGSGGYSVKKPLMYIGGSGGGASTTIAGGAGGNGAPGCGGGGGGAASTIASGAGGDGGNGIVIITSYFI